MKNRYIVGFNTANKTFWGVDDVDKPTEIRWVDSVTLRQAIKLATHLDKNRYSKRYIYKLVKVRSIDD